MRTPTTKWSTTSEVRVGEAHAKYLYFTAFHVSSDISPFVVHHLRRRSIEIKIEHESSVYALLSFSRLLIELSYQPSLLVCRPWPLICILLSSYMYPHLFLIHLILLSCIQVITPTCILFCSMLHIISCILSNILSVIPLVLVISLIS